MGLLSNGHTTPEKRKKKKKRSWQAVAVLAKSK